jgi:hypothetical protein
MVSLKKSSDVLSSYPYLPSPIRIQVADTMGPGGNDVFVDIGDKSLGVRCCQRYLGGVDGSRTLHIGDQFLSAGANDFKVSSLPFQGVFELADT